MNSPATLRSFDQFFRGYAPNGYSFARHSHALKSLGDALSLGDADLARLWGRTLARLGAKAGDIERRILR